MKIFEKKALFIFNKTISMALKIMILDRKIRGLKGPQLIPTIADTSQFSVQYFTCSYSWPDTNCKCSLKLLSYIHLLTMFSMSAHKWINIQFFCGGGTFQRCMWSYCYHIVTVRSCLILLLLSVYYRWLKSIISSTDTMMTKVTFHWLTYY